MRPPAHVMPLRTAFVGPMFNRTNYTRTRSQFEHEEARLETLLDQHGITLRNPSTVASREYAYELLERGLYEEELREEKRATITFERALKAHQDYILEAMRVMSGQMIILTRDRIDEASSHSNLKRASDIIEDAQRYFRIAVNQSELSYGVKFSNYENAALLADRAYDEVEGYQWQDGLTGVILMVGFVALLAGMLRMVGLV